MICKKCGLRDGYASDMFNPKRLICDVCGGDEWISFKRTKVLKGETRVVKIPLIIDPLVVISEGLILKVGKVKKTYTECENCQVMINEIREDVFNKDNILDETTKTKGVYLGGGSLTEISTKWIYNNTEVINESV